MVEYKITDSQYDVFGASMTVDTETDVQSADYLASCRSCQCNCRLCRGGKMPDTPEVARGAEVESALSSLLAA